MIKLKQYQLLMHQLLQLDGSRSMTGNLKMGDKKITDLDTRDDVPITDYPDYD